MSILLLYLHIREVTTSGAADPKGPTLKFTFGRSSIYCHLYKLHFKGKPCLWFTWILLWCSAQGCKNIWDTNKWEILNTVIVCYTSFQFIVSQLQIQLCDTDISHFIVLCFIMLHRYCFLFFYKMKVCGNPVSSRSINTIFLTALARFVSLCLSHFGNSCTISNFFIIIMFVMVIWDQWTFKNCFLILKFYLSFNWSIVDLQHCVSFRCTA